MLRMAERNYYNERFNEVNGDIARTCRIINMILLKLNKGDGIRESRNNS